MEFGKCLNQLLNRRYENVIALFSIYYPGANHTKIICIFWLGKHFEMKYDEHCCRGDYQSDTSLCSPTAAC